MRRAYACLPHLCFSVQPHRLATAPKQRLLGGLSYTGQDGKQNSKKGDWQAATHLRQKRRHCAEALTLTLTIKLRQRQRQAQRQRNRRATTRLVMDVLHAFSQGCRAQPAAQQQVLSLVQAPPQHILSGGANSLSARAQHNLKCVSYCTGSTIAHPVTGGR